MKKEAKKMLDSLTERYPVLSACENETEKLAEALIGCYKNGGKLLVCGNGGSAADAEHIVGELMKGFCRKRPLDENEKAELERYGGDGVMLANKIQSALPAISLFNETSLITAYSNDEDPSLIYAQQVYALGKPGDVLLCISTSGNSENVCLAVPAAKARGMTVAALTGKTGGKLKNICDICIAVPETETYKAQELHLPVYHAVCLCLEEEFFG
ncbi:MAG: SIS domain-containing protein [Clostridia bacterium]|nr:SIS domain-containing protein [Clostridia bacterium]